MIDTDILAGFLADPGKAQEQLRTMIAERAATDERFAALAQFALRPEEPVADVSPVAPAAPRTDISHIRARIADMRDELIAQTRRNLLLARALGACSQCWGASEDCSECQGRGAAGWRSSDISLFQELVAPAFARITAEKRDQQQEEGSKP